MLFRQIQTIVFLAVCSSAVCLALGFGFGKARSESEPLHIRLYQNIDEEGFIVTSDNVYPHSEDGTVERSYVVIDPGVECDQAAFDGSQQTYQLGDRIPTSGNQGKVYCFRAVIPSGGSDFAIYKASSAIGSKRIALSYSVLDKASVSERAVGLVTVQHDGFDQTGFVYMFAELDDGQACDHRAVEQAHYQPGQPTLLYNVTGRLVDYDPAEPIDINQEHLGFAVCLIAGTEDEIFYRTSQTFVFQTISVYEDIVRQGPVIARYDFSAYDDRIQDSSWKYGFVDSSAVCDQQALGNDAPDYTEGSVIHVYAVDQKYHGMKICFQSVFEGRADYVATSVITFPDDSASISELDSDSLDQPFWESNFIRFGSALILLLVLIGLAYFVTDHSKNKSG